MALLKLGENIGIMSDNEKIEFSKFKSKLDAEVKKRLNQIEDYIVEKKLVNYEIHILYHNLY